MFCTRVFDACVGKMSEKHIIMLTLYDALSCIETEENKKVFITLIQNQKERRLSRSKGNVNMTDYWFTMLEEFKEHDLKYMTQYIALMGDYGVNWWNEVGQKEQWIGLGFLKVKEEQNYKYNCEQIKKDLQEKYKSAMFYYTFGNADFVACLTAESEEEVRTQIKEISSWNISSTDNSPFSSSFFIGGEIKKEGEKEKKWLLIPMDIKNEECYKYSLELEGWFATKIFSLSEKMKKYLDSADKKMASYYQVLIQIMNVIAQYEQEPLHKDLYYMFFPSIHLFLQQLEDSQNKILAHDFQNEREKYVIIQAIENSISKFLDDMEIVLHHIGQSCRDIFYDNGRGGMPYDIPIKLCKMYMMFLSALTSILNDEKNYEYQYCLAPLAYSRPTTAYLDFGLPAHSRLIDVQISRSMFYMPRSLLVILAHEVSHYVGTNVRKRKERAEQYMEIAIIALCYYLIPDNFLEDCDISRSALNQEEVQLFEEYIEYLQREIYKYFRMEIQEIYRQIKSEQKKIMM